jgi:hypothetical protein
MPTSPAARLGVALLVPLLVGGPCLCQARGQDARVETRHVPRRTFWIPYSVEPGQRAVREFQLYVAGERGGWEWHAKGQPPKGSFEVRLDRDGTFTFAVRTEYTDGRLEPANLNDLRPTLRVVVDTAAPTAVLKPCPWRDGVAGVEWDVRDEHLDLASLRLDCRWPGQTNWLPLDADLGTATGRGFWKLTPAQRMEVRLHARDQAGHVVERTVWIGAGAGEAAEPFTTTAGASSSGHAGIGGSGQQAPLFFINEKRVPLDFTVSEIGPSGLAGVELWVTRDRQRWDLVKQPAGGPTLTPGPDGTAKAVLHYDAPEEGRYGFAMLAKSNTGLQGQNAPQPGEEPSVWVEVDTTKPKVKLQEVRLGPGDDVRHLTIYWESSDKNLTAQPIALEYSQTPTGPWTEIAGPLENVGKYAWTSPAEGPFKFYVRVRARDRAGNEGADVSKLVIADAKKPMVRINAIDPARGGLGRLP